MNRTISRYIEKNILYPRFVAELPRKSLGIIIVIPCYNEPDITTTLRSLMNCTPPKCEVEVIVSINAGENDDDRVKESNEISKIQIEKLRKELPSWLNVFAIVNNDLPQKKAHV